MRYNFLAFVTLWVISSGQRFNDLSTLEDWQNRSGRASDPCSTEAASLIYECNPERTVITIDEWLSITYAFLSYQFFKAQVHLYLAITVGSFVVCFFCCTPIFFGCWCCDKEENRSKKYIRNTPVKIS
jgi:hypothetical protein